MIKLKYMDYMELKSEFCEKIGNECGDFEDLIRHGGQAKVIDRLVLKFTDDLYMKEEECDNT